MTTDPADRVAEFLRQWKRPGGQRGDLIYGVHTDPETDGAELTVRDLEAVLALARRRSGR